MRTREQQIDDSLIETISVENDGGTWSTTTTGIRRRAEMFFDDCRDNGHVDAASRVLVALVNLYDTELVNRFETEQARINRALFDQESGLDTDKQDKSNTRTKHSTLYTNALVNAGSQLTIAQSDYALDRHKDAMRTLDLLEGQAIAWQASDSLQPWTSLLMCIWHVRAVFSGNGKLDVAIFVAVTEGLNRADIAPLIIAYPIDPPKTVEEVLGVNETVPFPDDKTVEAFDFSEQEVNDTPLLDSKDTPESEDSALEENSDDAGSGPVQT